MNKICISSSVPENTVPMFRLPVKWLIFWKECWAIQLWMGLRLSRGFIENWIHFCALSWRFFLGTSRRYVFVSSKETSLPVTPCHNIIVSYILNIKYLLSRSIKTSIGIRIIIMLLLIINSIIRLVKIGVKLVQVWHPEKYKCFCTEKFGSQ